MRHTDSNLRSIVKYHPSHLSRWNIFAVLYRITKSKIVETEYLQMTSANKNTHTHTHTHTHIQIHTYTDVNLWLDVFM